MHVQVLPRSSFSAAVVHQFKPLQYLKELTGTGPTNLALRPAGGLAGGLAY